MNYKKSYIALNKIIKRNINTTVLKDVLSNLAIDKNFYNLKGKINNSDLTNHYNKLFEKNIKVDKKEFDYTNIEQNLKESEQLLNKVSEEFNKVKGNTQTIDIEVKEVNIKSNKMSIDNLNDLNKTNQKSIEINNLQKINQEDSIEKVNNVCTMESSYKKSILEIDWLQPFLDFMNNHSTLMLTISSGLIMGGMWYLNNVGYINIGSLLTRLGIRIFANNNNSNQIPQTVNTNTINNVSGNTERAIGQGFFRQLGVKVLELLEVFIENMKNKKQNYK